MRQVQSDLPLFLALPAARARRCGRVCLERIAITLTGRLTGSVPRAVASGLQAPAPLATARGTDPYCHLSMPYIDLQSALVSGLRLRVRCGAICLIALFVSLSNQESNQERGASKQVAAPRPYLHLQTAISRWSIWTIFNSQ